MVGTFPGPSPELLHTTFPPGHVLMPPAIKMFGISMVNLVLQRIDDANHPVGSKGGVEMHHILGQELFPESFVFQQAPDHKGGFVGIGPFGPASLCGKFEHIDGRIEIIEPVAEFQVEENESPF